MKTTPDCICDGKAPWCSVCLVSVAFRMRNEHPDTLSVSMLKRRIPRLTGREAAILLEATQRLPARRNGGYVTRSPA
ncbi:hypothetical protein LCGC14_0676690 [marine sediment metagenome]|uniref:Uncharacterized protein n=1 Tax=marine sediment metagenome TaxID=412755 RepID=A0A0F9QPC5_9ZZZZ